MRGHSRRRANGGKTTRSGHWCAAWSDDNYGPGHAFCMSAASEENRHVQSSGTTRPLACSTALSGGHSNVSSALQCQWTGACGAPTPLAVPPVVNSPSAVRFPPIGPFDELYSPKTDFITPDHRRAPHRPHHRVYLTPKLFTPKFPSSTREEGTCASSASGAGRPAFTSAY